MPKPVKKASPKPISAFMSQLGSKGAPVGGAQRMESLTDKQRREIAMKAAKARWQKRSAQS
jgi:hypothetical protein